MAQTARLDRGDDLAHLRERALIATLSYSVARINAGALKMKVEDLRPHGAGWTVKLHEKGGKQHAMPCHHALAEVLRAYIDPPASPRTVSDGCSSPGGYNDSALSDKPMSPTRCLADDPPPRRSVATVSRNPDHRLTRRRRRLEHAQQMAAHESPRKTKLYDRTKERLTQGEVERDPAVSN